MKASKFLLCFIMTFLTSFNLQAQHERDNWIFGDSLFLGFNGGMVNFINGTTLSIGESYCSISNNNGDLLFYAGSISNSQYAQLFDRAFTDLDNGDSIYNPYTTNQGILILPFPDDSNKYYLFASSKDYMNNPFSNEHYLFFSVIDMLMDSGYGEVVTKNQKLNDSLIAKPLYAIKHGNGRDWWLVYHAMDATVQNRFYKLLITPTGISGPYIQNLGRAQVQTNWGPLLANPEGDRVVFGGAYRLLDLFSFDRCNGLLYDYVALGDSTLIYYDAYRGCSFSPDGSKLYASTYDSLFQFDMNAANIKSSQTLIATTPVIPHTYINQHQLGPDGKIYITNPTTLSNGDTLTSYLGVIHNPDSISTTCNYNMYDFSLNGHSARGLPNLPMYHLGRLQGSPCDTLQWTAIENSQYDSTIKIYPNPATDKIIISAQPNCFIEDVEIFSVTGEMVLKKKLNAKLSNITFDVGILNNGVYILKIKTSKGVVFKKLIMQ